MTRLSIKIAEFFMQKGMTFQELCAAQLTPLVCKNIHVYGSLCIKILTLIKAVCLWEAGQHTDRRLSWSALFHAGTAALPHGACLPLRGSSPLMTAYESVTLGSLDQSNVAPCASPASCPLPSVSKSASPKAAGARCHPQITTGPAPG